MINWQVKAKSHCEHDWVHSAGPLAVLAQKHYSQNKAAEHEYVLSNDNKRMSQVPRVVFRGVWVLLSQIR